MTSSSKRFNRGPSKLQRRQAAFILDPESAATRELERFRREFLAGDKGMLPIAIRLCGKMGRQLPEWIVAAWDDACIAVNRGTVAGWDHVLMQEPPRTKKQYERRQEDARMTYRLLTLLPFLRNEPIDDNFFKVVANHLEKTPEQVRKFYYRLPPDARLPAKRNRPPPKKALVPKKR
jgi:hypothetical protein